IHPCSSINANVRASTSSQVHPSQMRHTMTSRSSPRSDGRECQGSPAQPVGPLVHGGARGRPWGANARRVDGPEEARGHGKLALMAMRDIRIVGDPVLRTVCDEITAIDDRV